MKHLIGTLCVLVGLSAFASDAAAQRAFALLAASWQPAFCEARADRPECATQTASRHDASHFSLHGLWPQPRGKQYCGVPQRLVDIDKQGRWGSLPRLSLSGRLRSRLEQTMQGRVASARRARSASSSAPASVVKMRVLTPGGITANRLWSSGSTAP